MVAWEFHMECSRVVNQVRLHGRRYIAISPQGLRKPNIPESKIVRHRAIVLQSPWVDEGKVGDRGSHSSNLPSSSMAESSPFRRDMLPIGPTDLGLLCGKLWRKIPSSLLTRSTPAFSKGAPYAPFLRLTYLLLRLRCQWEM